MIDVAALARESGFDRVAEQVAALARPSLWIVPGDGRSRFGGMPDLPPDLPWPVTEWDAPGFSGLEMTFFAQLDLAELDPSVWVGPPAGLLAFFCRQDPESGAVDGPGSARVVHLPAGAQLEPRPGPSVAEMRMAFRPELTVPALGAAPLGLDWVQDGEAYAAFEERLAEAQGIAPRTRESGWRVQHRLLGWPRPVQDDPLLDIAIAYEAGPVESLRLLLQIESDRRLGTDFAIPEEDLLAGCFDHVEAILQSG